ncbi:hypothetical protein [Siphonobacter sp.]|uniref:hypothetical protein n=1 Tax=Siphonobacter sp. TaxID=1869184 RepID=UPI003B3BB86E
MNTTDQDQVREQLSTIIRTNSNSCTTIFLPFHTNLDRFIEWLSYPGDQTPFDHVL